MQILHQVLKFIGFLKGLDFDTTALAVIRTVSVTIMAFKLKIANEKIAEWAKEAGLEVPEVEESAFHPTPSGVSLLEPISNSSSTKSSLSSSFSSPSSTRWVRRRRVCRELLPPLLEPPDE